MSSSVWGGDKTQYFNELTPNKVLDAIEEIGFNPTGRIMILASMENRVYEVEVPIDNPQTPSEDFKIIKFYRPGRWSKEQIQDEHDFIFDLINNDLNAIAPLKINDESVFTDTNGLYYAVFPKKGGRAADEWTNDLIGQMGRLLARVHNTGQARQAEHRLKLDIDTYGRANLELILKSQYFPMEHKSKYENLANQVFTLSEPLFKNIKTQRVHGDCHHGNILLNNNNPFLIDFDDMVIAPRVQDLWMIVPGRDEYSINLRESLISAYCEMTDFDFRELKLIESLRTLRIIHFSAWISSRFEDQSFKNAFPNFGTHQYWEKELFDLQEQIGYIQDNLN